MQLESLWLQPAAALGNMQDILFITTTEMPHSGYAALMLLSSNNSSYPNSAVHPTDNLPSRLLFSPPDPIQGLPCTRCQVSSPFTQTSPSAFLILDAYIFEELDQGSTMHEGCPPLPGHGPVLGEGMGGQEVPRKADTVPAW